MADPATLTTFMAIGDQRPFVRTHVSENLSIRFIVDWIFSLSSDTGHCGIFRLCQTAFVAFEGAEP